jgi:hypothetical protein
VLIGPLEKLVPYLPFISSQFYWLFLSLATLHKATNRRPSASVAFLG